MIKLIASLLLLSLFSFNASSQQDCIRLDSKGRKQLKESVRNYMADTLSITRIKISDPSFSPYEAHYEYVQQHRDNCDSMIRIPVYYLRVAGPGKENYWEFMLDVRGSVIIAIRENATGPDSWYREYNSANTD